MGRPRKTQDYRANGVFVRDVVVETPNEGQLFLGLSSGFKP